MAVCLSLLAAAFSHDLRLRHGLVRPVAMRSAAMDGATHEQLTTAGAHEHAHALHALHEHHELSEL